MAFITINGANLFYETYGDDHPGQDPILLIHGSTVTGQEDWGMIAPILARKRRVILPDCRGHGRSSNPGHSYQFSEMAADMAALIRNLGYDRAHVIGHSNGGNVALVMAVEHPEVIGAAILQAANAYVDDFLRVREPGVFDPERILHEAPAWMEQMQRLHSPTHGAEYWRELLSLTLNEILSAPNYAAETLARVQLPTLVIQGALDPVNAPSAHGEYIARHIPFAELWVPAGIAHNVHHEIPTEWIDRVEGFLERRGDRYNDALHRLGVEVYADRREWIFELRAAAQGAADAPIRLNGRVLYAEQLQAAVSRLQSVADQPVDAADAAVLYTDETPRALVRRGVVDVRRGTRIVSERVSQGLLGEAVRVLDLKDGWSYVRMDHDGYMGWIDSAHLWSCSAEAVREYQASCSRRVIAEIAPAWADLKFAGDQSRICGKLPFAARVAVTQADEKGFSQIRLPDGQLWWLQSADLLPLELCPHPDPTGIDQLLRLVRRFVGLPYLWGGRSPFGYDCSGLAGIFWDMLGVPLPRDADQQFRRGSVVEGPPQPGDLLFFGEGEAEGRESRFKHITHVGIAIDDRRIIHSTGAVWGVTINSLQPGDADDRPWLRDHLAGIRRYTPEAPASTP